MIYGRNLVRTRAPQLQSARPSILTKLQLDPRLTRLPANYNVAAIRPSQNRWEPIRADKPTLRYSPPPAEIYLAKVVQDYYARAVIRLSPKPCAGAMAAAKSLGYRELPLPKDLNPAQEFHAPLTPTYGFFRYLEPRPEKMRFSWIDAETCRVCVEFHLD
jgi:hypothetical protein